MAKAVTATLSGKDYGKIHFPTTHSWFKHTDLSNNRTTFNTNLPMPSIGHSWYRQSHQSSYDTVFTPHTANIASKPSSPKKSYSWLAKAAACVGLGWLLSSDSEAEDNELSADKKAEYLYEKFYHELLAGQDEAIVAILKDESGYLVINTFLRNHPECIDQIVHSIGFNIKKIMQCCYTPDFFQKFLTEHCSKEHSIFLAQQIALDTKKLIKTENGKRCIQTIVTSYPDALGVIAHYDCNFNLLAGSPIGHDLVEEFFEKLSLNHQKALLHKAIIYYKAYLSLDRINLFINIILHQGGPLFHEYIINNFNHLPLPLLKYLGTLAGYDFSNICFDQKIIKKIDLPTHASSFSEITRLMWYAHTCKSTPIKLPGVTQTQKHLTMLFNNKVSINQRPLSAYCEQQELTDSADEIIAKEKILDSQGYYTFLHGQKNSFYFPLKLHTFLFSAVQGKKVDDFILTRIIQMPLTVQQQQREEELIKERWLWETQDGLFMNYALFANHTFSGSNSAHYIAHNTNASPSIRFSAQDVLAKHNLTSVYNVFKTELDALENEYKSLSSKGNTLLIAVPKRDVNKYVYATTHHNGYAKGIRHDVDTVLEQLRSDQDIDFDRNHIEFCLLMAHKDGGLDPDTGIKIFPIVTGNKEKLRTLEEKTNALFERMKPYITKTLS